MAPKVGRIEGPRIERERVREKKRKPRVLWSYTTMHDGMGIAKGTMC